MGMHTCSQCDREVDVSKDNAGIWDWNGIYAYTCGKCLDDMRDGDLPVPLKLPPKAQAAMDEMKEALAVDISYLRGLAEAMEDTPRDDGVPACPSVCTA